MAFVFLAASGTQQPVFNIGLFSSTLGSVYFEVMTAVKLFAVRTCLFFLVCFSQNCFTTGCEKYAVKDTDLLAKEALIFTFCTV